MYQATLIDVYEHTGDSLFNVLAQETKGTSRRHLRVGWKLYWVKVCQAVSALMAFVFALLNLFIQNRKTIKTLSDLRQQGIVNMGLSITCPIEGSLMKWKLI